MTTTWALVADRSRARILANHGPGKGLELVEELSHPAGRQQDRELKSDKGGRAFDSGGEGRHTMETQVLPHEHEAEVFARELAAKLESGREANRFQQLVIAAEPEFLGLLRKALSSTSRKLVVGEVPKHLLGAGDGDIAQHLAAVMKV